MLYCCIFINKERCIHKRQTVFVHHFQPSIYGISYIKKSSVCKQQVTPSLLRCQSKIHITHYGKFSYTTHTFNLRLSYASRTCVCVNVSPEITEQLVATVSNGVPKSRHPMCETTKYKDERPATKNCDANGFGNGSLRLASQPTMPCNALYMCLNVCVFV